MSLTPEGEVLHERCKELPDGLEEAETELHARTGEVPGQLRVNVPVSFGRMHLAPWGRVPIDFLVDAFRTPSWLA